MAAERFVSEAVKPAAGTFNAYSMAAGAPGLPSAFVWRGRSFRVETVIKTWHTTGRCSHGSPEMYVRKHWFDVLTDTGCVMRLYFERHARRGKDPAGERWVLFSVRGEECGEPDGVKKAVV